MISMLRNIKVLFLLLFSLTFANAQDLRPASCFILSGTITCGANSVSIGTGGPFLPLTGGTLSGGLVGTTANFSGIISGSNLNLTSATPTIKLGGILRVVNDDQHTAGIISAGNLTLTSTISANNASYIIGSTTALTDYTGASAGTITNAPSIGNPTKWIAINDNGTLRKIPAW